MNRRWPQHRSQAGTTLGFSPSSHQRDARGSLRNKGPGLRAAGHAVSRQEALVPSPPRRAHSRAHRRPSGATPSPPQRRGPHGGGRQDAQPGAQRDSAAFTQTPLKSETPTSQLGLRAKERVKSSDGSLTCCCGHPYFTINTPTPCERR